MGINIIENKELEEEIDRASKLFYEEVGWDCDEGSRAYVADWFAHYFANWQKQQMMKEAVEGLVVCDELTHYYKDIVMPIPDYLKVGDKVKLIIIKNE